VERKGKGKGREMGGNGRGGERRKGGEGGREGGVGKNVKPRARKVASPPLISSEVVVEVQDLSLALVLNTSLVLCFFALSLSEFRFE